MTHATPLAERLIYQRKLKGLSQEQLADLTRVTVRTIQRLEKGEVQPQPRTIKQLALALDITVDDLLQLDDPREEAIQSRWLLLIHSAPFVGFVIPLFNIILPLFLWHFKKDDNVVYDRHGRAVLNFQITVTALFVLSLVALLTIEGVGFLLFIAVIPFSVCVMLANIVAVLRAQKCYYPLAMPVMGRTGRKAHSNVPMLLFALGVGAVGVPDKANASEIQTVGQQTLEFEKFISGYQKKHHIPGMSIAISKQGELVYAKGIGVSHLSGRVPVSTDTPFWIASISKFFVGTAFLSLVEAGELSLDDELNETPEFAQYCEWLANSGIVFGENLNCQQTFKLKHALNHVVNGTVDTQFFYNSIFYSRLSRFLEAKRGNSIEAAKGRHNELAKTITAAILEPAAMQHSIAGLWDNKRQDVYFRLARGYGIENGQYVMRPAPQRHMAGGAGVSATAADIVRFDSALDAGLVLSQKYKALMETPYITESGNPIPYAYGRFIQTVNGETIIWHGGWDEDAGNSALYIKFPERQITAVVLANSEGLWWGNPLDKASIETSPVFQAASTIFPN